ncbi:MAG: TRAP transporter small permease [Candidatus Odyssella sp.]|nr:TRAP transporter small permease [Candidatus Odyssella sp.]
MKIVYKWLLALLLLAILAVSIIDVAGRYLLNKPLQGADDLIRFGMGLVVFAALPAVCRAGEHIAVDLLSSRMSAGARALLERVFRVAAAVLLAFVAWRLYVLGAAALGSGERSPILLLPYPPLIFAMAAFALISGLVEILRAFEPIPRVAAGGPDPKAG